MRDYFNLEKSDVMCKEMMPLCGGDDVSEIARQRRSNGCDGMRYQAEKQNS